MTIRARLKKKANRIIKRAEGREFTSSESEFLHMVNTLVQWQMISAFYRRENCVGGIMRYQPETHTGTREEILRGLITEFNSVMHSGTLRLHAQDRESERIYDAIKTHGVLLMGDGLKWFAVEHKPECVPYWKDDGVWEKDCSCPNIVEVDGTI